MPINKNTGNLGKHEHQSAQKIAKFFNTKTKVVHRKGKVKHVAGSRKVQCAQQIYIYIFFKADTVYGK
jgi:hypothetical protein